MYAGSKPIILYASAHLSASMDIHLYRPTWLRQWLFFPFSSRSYIRWFL